MMKLHKAVELAVELLRRKVPKPSKIGMHALSPRGTVVRFRARKRMNWPTTIPLCPCPMGLFSASLQPVPCSPKQASGSWIVDESIRRSINFFIGWWDTLTLTEAREVVDLIWPDAVAA